MVPPYTHLAADYDAIFGLPFFRQIRHVFETLARKYGIRFQSAADIGCGTGLFARHLNLSRQIPVFAVDLSEPMLRIAQRNCCGAKVTLLRQDIRSLRLPHPVDLITANFDTLNHLVRFRDLQNTLQRIFDNLNEGGHLIFDLITRCLPLDRAGSYIRQFYRPRRRVVQVVRLNPLRNILSVAVTINSSRLSKPIVEQHCERAYSTGEVGRALHETGFSILGVHDAATLTLAGRCPSRIIVVARKAMK